MGANDYDQAVRYGKKLTFLAFLCKAALCLVFAVALPVVILPFSLSAETAALTCQIMRVYYLLGGLIWVVRAAVSAERENGRMTTGSARKKTRQSAALHKKARKVSFLP